MPLSCSQTLLAIAFGLMSFAATAAELPISGAYGSPDGCRIYAAYGIDGVKAGKGTNVTEDFPVVFAPDGIVGGEFACDILDATGNTATLFCYGEGVEEKVPAKFHETDGTLVIAIDSDPPITLHRCASPSS